MKIIIIICISLFCLADLLTASGGISAEFGVCSDLGMSLDFRLNHENKGLPKSWDEFEKVRIMKNGTMKHQLFSAKTTNSFALVPGAPVIKAQLGIPHEYPGYRLVFISREGGKSKSSGIGRCALLADPGRENSKQFTVYPVFFPEDVAQIILKQIDGFDPKKQPVAFEDMTQFEREEKQFRDNIRTTTGSLSSEGSKESAGDQSGGNGLSVTDKKNQNARVRDVNHLPKWIVVGVALVLLLVAVAWLTLKPR